MITSLCPRDRHRKRDRITNRLPALTNREVSRPCSLPKLHQKNRATESLKNVSTGYLKGFTGSAPSLSSSNVPALRRYDSERKKPTNPSQVKQNNLKKLIGLQEPMPEWLPELLSAKTSLFSKDFPTNFLLSRSRFWPSQPRKSDLYFGKTLKWPKVKNMVVKHPKFIESCREEREPFASVANAKTIFKLSHLRKGGHYFMKNKKKSVS